MTARRLKVSADLCPETLRAVADEFELQAREARKVLREVRLKYVAPRMPDLERVWARYAREYARTAKRFRNIATRVEKKKRARSGGTHG